MNQPSNNPADGKVNLAAAPGADINFDELFPVEPENLGAPQAAPEGTNTPQTPQAPEFVIKSEDGKIVYKTAEEAISGIRHKDQLVERYRTYLQSQGVDPNTLQKAPEPQVHQTPNGPQHKYIGQEDKLFDALSGAVSRGDKKAYATALREYNEEVMNQSFAPVAPYIAEVARQKAVREVSKEAPEFINFQNSPAWQETLDSLPKLKQAIEYGENDFAAAGSLSELYKIAFLVSRGLNRPAPVAQPVQQVTTPAPVARPTLGVSTMTPPQPSAPASMATKEGRDALLADLLSRGVKDRTF